MNTKYIQEQLPQIDFTHKLTSKICKTKHKIHRISEANYLLETITDVYIYIWSLKLKSHIRSKSSTTDFIMFRLCYNFLIDHFYLCPLLNNTIFSLSFPFIFWHI